MAQFIYRHRRGTTEKWQAATSIIPYDGELIIEECADGTVAIKVGDGTHTFNDLPYVSKDEIAKSDLAQALKDEIDGKATKKYVDDAIAKIPVPDVGDQISKHDTSSTAHSDIRTAIGKKLDASAVTGDLLTHNASEFAKAEHDHAIADVTGLQSELDGKQAKGNYVTAVTGKGLSTNDFTTAEKEKLAGIAIGANNYTYTLPAAGTDLGGVKTGGGVTINAGVITVGEDSHIHTFATVTGLQSALDGKQAKGSYATAGHKHEKSEITDFPTLATVATTGSYNDLSNKPAIPAAYSHPENHPASMITGLADVATSGSYNDLSNKPTIPTKSSWNYDDAYVKYSTAQSLNDTQKTQARSNIGAGTSNLTIGTTASTAAAGNHTHNYAGSSSAGGSAASAVKLDTATAGSATQPVYFADGKPTACTYTLEKSVPSDAKFTDTTYSAATKSADGLMSSTDKEHLDALAALLEGEASTIDTIEEVLKAFENAPEGTNIANALAGKSDTGHSHTLTPTTATVVKEINSGSGSFTPTTKYLHTTTTSAAPNSHTHNVTVSGTTGANSGSAVTAVTSVGTLSGGSGNLTVNTTASTGDIAYVESVTHTAASLTGTKTFNTDAIKDITLSASTTTTAGPKYVESISGSAPSLTGTTTFVTAQGSFSGGSGSLTSNDTASGGIPYLTASYDSTNKKLTLTTKYLHHAHTAATLGAASTGSVGISGGSYSATTKYMAHSNTEASTGTVGISGGSITPTTKYLHHTHTGASLSGTTTDSVAPSGHTHSYGSSTALTTTANSGSAVSAITGLAVNTTASAGDITYIESATHTHNGASVKSSETVVKTVTMD